MPASLHRRRLLLAAAGGAVLAPAPQALAQDHRYGIRGRRAPSLAVPWWIDAAGEYMCVHVKGETHIMRTTMKELETKLDPSIFQRVHRSTIVNLQRVEKVSSHINGEFHLTLSCGTSLKMSRSYKEKVKHFF